MSEAETVRISIIPRTQLYWQRFIRIFQVVDRETGEGETQLGEQGESLENQREHLRIRQFPAQRDFDPGKRKTFSGGRRAKGQIGDATAACGRTGSGYDARKARSSGKEVGYHGIVRKGKLIFCVHIFHPALFIFTFNYFHSCYSLLVDG